MAKLNYVELPVGDVAGQVAFYSKAFGWTFTEYGPEYAAHEENETQLGLNGATDQSTANILPLVQVDDLEAARDAVIGAGGTITQDIFSYPGGRRFHFTDPAGLELGVYVAED